MGELCRISPPAIRIQAGWNPARGGTALHGLPFSEVSIVVLVQRHTNGYPNSNRHTGESRYPVFQNSPVHWLQAGNHKPGDACVAPMKGNGRGVAGRRAIAAGKSQAFPGEMSTSNRGTGILPVNHGRDAHATIRTGKVD